MKKIKSNLIKLAIIAGLFLTANIATAQCVSTNTVYVPQYNVWVTDNARTVSYYKTRLCFYNSITITGYTKAQIGAYIAALKTTNQVVVNDGYNLRIEGDASGGYYTDIIYLSDYTGCSQ